MHEPTSHNPHILPPQRHLFITPIASYNGLAGYEQPADVRMSNWLLLTTAVLLLCPAADIPGVERLRSAPTPDPTFSASDVIAIFPAAESDDQQQTQNRQKTDTLQEQTKLDLIRFVDGEFAKAVRPLPRGKDGFIVQVGKPIVWQALDSAVATHGAAVNTGDHCQITKLEFRAKTIVVDVNGGGRQKKSWRDRIHIEMGGPMPTTTTTTTTPQQENGPPGIQPGMGSTLYFEFDHAVPDLTPEELKQLLAPFLNFARERSASVQWVDTLPPEMKKAIQDRRPVVGMDREEVVAAIGKPERKVRERDAEGNEIEDWIYGQPPAKTVFVRFMGDRVTKIEQFPR